MLLCNNGPSNRRKSRSRQTQTSTNQEVSSRTYSHSQGARRQTGSTNTQQRVWHIMNACIPLLCSTPFPSTNKSWKKEQWKMRRKQKKQNKTKQNKGKQWINKWWKVRKQRWQANTISQPAVQPASQADGGKERKGHTSLREDKWMIHFSFLQQVHQSRSLAKCQKT